MSHHCNVDADSGPTVPREDLEEGNMDAVDITEIKSLKDLCCHFICSNNLPFRAPGVNARVSASLIQRYLNRPENQGYCLGCGASHHFMALRTGILEGLCPRCYTGCRAHLLFMPEGISQENPDKCFGCGESLPDYNIPSNWKKREYIRLVSFSRAGFANTVCPGCELRAQHRGATMECQHCGKTFPISYCPFWHNEMAFKIIDKKGLCLPYTTCNDCMPRHASVYICRGNPACHFEALLRPIRDSRLEHPMYRTCKNIDCFVCKSFFHNVRWASTGVNEPHLPLIATRHGLFIVDRDEIYI